MKESSAVIKLTKSEIEMIINALQFTEEAAEHFNADNILKKRANKKAIEYIKIILEGWSELLTVE